MRFLNSRTRISCEVIKSNDRHIISGYPIRSLLHYMSLSISNTGISFEIIQYEDLDIMCGYPVGTLIYHLRLSSSRRLYIMSGYSVQRLVYHLLLISVKSGISFEVKESHYSVTRFGLFEMGFLFRLNTKSIRRIPDRAGERICDYSTKTLSARQAKPNQR